MQLQNKILYDYLLSTTLAFLCINEFAYSPYSAISSNFSTITLQKQNLLFWIFFFFHKGGKKIGFPCQANGKEFRGFGGWENRDCVAL